MGRLKFIIAAIIISFVIFPCCNKKSRIDHDVPVITVKPGRNDDAKLVDGILEFSHYVILDPDGEVLIGRINKLQLIDGYIGIVDKNKAYLFDAEGKLHCSWSRYGRAGNEYLEMTDMEITRHNGKWECNVYDKMTKRILTYDEDDNLIYVKEELPEAQAFTYLDDGMLAFNAGNASSNVAEGDCFNYFCLKDGAKIITAVPFNYHFAGYGIKYGEGKSLFYHYGNETFFGSMHNDTVYHVSLKTGEISPFVCFDMGVKRPGINDSKATADDYMSKLHKGVIPSFPNVFYKFHNGFSAEYFYENRAYIIFADDSGDILYTGNSSRDKYGLSIRPVPYLDHDNSGYFISHFKPGTMDTAKKICKERNLDISLLDELSTKITEDSNPVLVFYKWIFGE